jgi:hypothetical protein
MIKDSGNRREFGTGGHRDCAEGKGRMDLLPFRALIELSKVFEDGAKKYDDNNWRKGLPLSCYVDSASRHLAKWMIGWRDEPHLEQAAWNIMCLIETQAMIKEGLLPADLNDLPYNPLEIEENPHKIPPLRTSSKRAQKADVAKAIKGVQMSLADIKAGDVKPIEQVIDEYNKASWPNTQMEFAYDERGMYCTNQPAAEPLREFTQLEDGI